MAAEYVTTKDFDRRLTVDIKLYFPVTVDGETVEVITMRRPNGKDSTRMASYKGTDAKKALLYTAGLCTVGGEPCTPDVIEALDDVDAEQLGEQLKAFTGRQADSSTSAS